MIKARINATGEVVEVRPCQTEIYDFMVCRNGGVMGELYMRSELTIIGDNELDFISLVKRMREAQKEERKWEIVNFKTEEDKIAYGEAIRGMYQLEYKVDEYLKKMEDETL